MGIPTGPMGFQWEWSFGNGKEWVHCSRKFPFALASYLVLLYLGYLYSVFVIKRPLTKWHVRGNYGNGNKFPNQDGIGNII